MSPFSISIVPTAEIVTHHGVPLRVWKGTTPDSVTCTVYVAIARVDPGAGLCCVRRGPDRAEATRKPRTELRGTDRWRKRHA